MTSRAQAKEEVRAALMAAARATIAEHGAAALSLRRLAREVGLVSSAVYRYVDSRDELLTLLLVESYGDLADALVAADGSPGLRWVAVAAALRDWARDRPHEFSLLYGTPVPGYRAPATTVAPAARVAAAFLAATRPEVPPAEEGLSAQLAEAAAGLGVGPARLARTLSALAHLVGVLLLDSGGHFVGTADPPDLLWEHIVSAQQRDLGA